ncbi:hypothetical protein DY245_25200 [Streptomyces inhibens]|uniref:Uncharacterized protein n=1 Tax=Streptomyces inhibens TaxID=2293571 RepID=A0A371PZ64_STRIH|nr:hypothetical protein DY245_25200 [Streptomyces inhibens]
MTHARNPGPGDGPGPGPGPGPGLGPGLGPAPLAWRHLGPSLRMHIAGRAGPGCGPAAPAPYAVLRRGALRRGRACRAPGRMRTVQGLLLVNAFAGATSCATVGGPAAGFVLRCPQAGRPAWASERGMVPEGERG